MNKLQIKQTPNVKNSGSAFFLQVIGQDYAVSKYLSIS